MCKAIHRLLVVLCLEGGGEGGEGQLLNKQEGTGDGEETGQEQN